MLMDWLYWHLLDQIATETDQSLLIFSPFCSLVSLLMPAQCLLVCTRILKETWRNICLDWKKTGSRGKAGQNVVVQKSSFKFPSNYWHHTRSMPAIFFAVSNLVQSSRYQAGVIWLQSSQSIMDWLHQAQTARQNHARRSQMKKLLVLSGFLDQKFAGNLKEVGQIVPDSVRILLCLQKRQNLVLSGSIWPASFNFPSNFWSRKPDRTSNFLSGSVWHDFVWLSGPWCSQGIILDLNGLFEKGRRVGTK